MTPIQNSLGSSIITSPSSRAETPYFTNALENGQHHAIRWDIPLLPADVSVTNCAPGVDDVEARALAERPGTMCNGVLLKNLLVLVGKDRERQTVGVGDLPNLFWSVRSNANDFSSAVCELLVIVAQPREMPLAKQSTSATQECQNDLRAIAIRGQTDHVTIGGGQSKVRRDGADGYTDRVARHGIPLIFQICVW